MKDIFRGNTPDSNREFKFQSQPPAPPKKDKPDSNEKPKVPAQSKLGQSPKGPRWDPNKPTVSTVKDD